jgi:arylsulfatase
MAGRPNILCCPVDDISTGDSGCCGGGITTGARTPDVDRVAADGLKLANCSVEAQFTPSRSASMTGP